MTLQEWLDKSNQLYEFQAACARKAEGEEKQFFLQTGLLLRELRARLIKDMASAIAHETRERNPWDE